MRGLHALTQAELTATLKRPAVFYEGEFASDTLNLWSGLGDKVWDSKTWAGAGALIGVSDITEAADIVANSVTFTLSGIPSDLIQIIHAQVRHGKPGRAWFGFLDSGGAVIANPYLAFKGRLDVPDIIDSGDTCTISITYESHLADLKRPRLFRWDHETQRLFFPDDRGFQYVQELQDQVLEW